MKKISINKTTQSEQYDTNMFSFVKYISKL